ncbi:MAG: FAD-dependent oxidoreductase, partial [Bacteroidota bacterium]|nr:FAD-dependent oxidoreductase [Bacteroidota bacterium]
MSNDKLFSRRSFLKTSGMLALASTLPILTTSARNGKKINDLLSTDRNSLVLKKTKILLDDQWDVIVIGGGPSGCAAAIAAAREGAKTLLIEAMGCLGGMGTSGLVPAWTPFSDGEKMVYKGIAEKVFNESKIGVPHEPKDKMDWVAINPEWLKLVYDRMVAKSNAKVLFFSRLAAVQMKNEEEVEAIIISNKSGLTAYRAKVYIDCTGDGDLAAWAGASFTKGNAAGIAMPATHCFEIVNLNVNPTNVESFNALYGGNKNSPIWDMAASGKYPAIKDAHLCINYIGPNAVGLNAGHLFEVDSTNPQSLSDAMSRGRELANQFMAGLKEFRPEIFANSFLVNTGQLMGIRESRIIEGDYTLTLKDWMARAGFPDEIGRNNYFIDIHNSKEDIGKVLKERSFENLGRPEPYKRGESHGIPYRCLTPKGLKNVLVAGRCISTEQIVQGSVRIQPACLVTGEA